MEDPNRIYLNNAVMTKNWMYMHHEMIFKAFTYNKLIDMESDVEWRFIS